MARTTKKATDADRLPPHSEEAEDGVLGCCLLDPAACVPQMVARFGKDLAGAFYTVRGQVVAQHMAALADKGVAFDVVTLYQRIRDAGDMDMAGGIDFVSKLPERATSAAMMGHYLDIMQGKLRLRKLLRVCTEASEGVFRCNGEHDEFIDRVEREVMAVRQGGGVDRKTIKQAVIDATVRMERAIEKRGELDGLPTGFADWDRMTGGLHRSELTVLSGRPGGGKTSLAMNVAAHVATELRKPVGVFSLEMSVDMLTMRLICALSRVDLRAARKGELTQDNFASLTAAAVKLSGSPLHIDDESDLTLAELRAKARRMRSEHGVELFVLDYLQLVAGQEGGREDNEEQRLSSVARALKATAMELDAPVLAMSQINDAGQLRGSRAIGHHADNVCRLRKKPQGKGGEDEHADLGEDVVPVELLLLKQRNGPTGKVPLTFLRRYVRFESAAKVET
jgi:replicative DNA helicase